MELALFFLLLQSAFALNSRIERAALLDLRSSLGLRSKEWPRKSDPCLVWIGVQCQDGQVVGINISGLRRTHTGRLNPQFSVDSLSNLTHLASFNSSGFSLPGSIPEWFGHRLLSLQVLDLSSSSVFGPIPWSLGNLTNLNSLSLSHNNLTGTVPSSLGQLSRLSVLDLSQNSLAGSIPLSFSSLGNLTFLDLSSNFFSGSIPPALGTLFNLKYLNLSNNSFSAFIPIQLGGLSSLVDIDLSSNSLSGYFPKELKGLRALQRMVLGNNFLSGSLPENFFSRLPWLQLVVLSHNNFSGALPASLWSLPGLRFLDVSDNSFTGFLPNLSSNPTATSAVFNLSQNFFYGALTSLPGRYNFIDLSDNYIQGKIPDEYHSNASLEQNCLQNEPNQKGRENCTSFYMERGLNYNNFGAPNTVQSPVKEPSSKNRKRLTFILVGVFGGLGFILILIMVLALFLYIWKKGSNEQRGTSVGPIPSGRSPLNTRVSINFAGLGEAYTYDELLKATRDFGNSNLIKHGHSGDLFEGVLQNGIPVVIKRIDLCSIKKEKYMAELGIFSKIAHSRLVPFLGHYLEQENEKLLVYKYMPNLDLATSLYKKSDSEDDSIQSLDWITRLKIAFGAAQGLSYLHHECTPPLVHRDVQASSILLDDKFEVRLGSLSEVCSQEGDQENVITRLLRLPQSSDQNPSGTPPATCSYDVYCFGKVLLELVTGKLGISLSDDAAMEEWLEHTLPYISIYEKELVTKIIDPSLIVDEDLLEEVWAMAVIAKSCLNPKPSKRPLMRYVLKALENPLKVVREEKSSSARLRVTSSRGSWHASLFTSWRHSSSEILAFAGREGGSSLKRSGTSGSQGGGIGIGFEHSSSRKRLSCEIFPEPGYVQDNERYEDL